MNELPQFPAKLKLRLLEAARRLRLRRSTGRVLEELVDNPRSAYWSNDRMAASLMFSVRTVELALAELRAHGFLRMQYRRKMTAIKRICVDAVLLAVAHGVEAAKRACEAAKSLIRKRIQDPQRISAYIHSCFKNGDESASWRVQGAPSPSLLRSLGLLGDPSRR